MSEERICFEMSRAGIAVVVCRAGIPCYGRPLAENDDPIPCAAWRNGRCSLINNPDAKDSALEEMQAQVKGFAGQVDMWRERALWAKRRLTTWHGWNENAPFPRQWIAGDWPDVRDNTRGWK